VLFESNLNYFLPNLKPVRGKVTAGGFRIKSIRISCIEISDESLRSPLQGPEGKRNVAISLSEHVLSSTCIAYE
jgi:hypothetical protein